MLEGFPTEGLGLISQGLIELAMVPIKIGECELAESDMGEG